MSNQRVNEYLKAERELKQKFEELKYGRYVLGSHVNEHLAPILNPLREINAKIKNPPPDLHLSDAEIASNKRKIDILLGGQDKNYGVRVEKDGFYIGNCAVDVVGDNLVLKDSGKMFVGTPGLWELLTHPKPTEYTAKDFERYGELVKDTFLYKRDNNPNTHKVKSNGSYKYNKIVKPLIDKYNLRSSKKQDNKLGEGLRKVVAHGNNNVEYVYWNTIDELLERLYILYGEIKAGNTNPALRNEISNIIQEFKEQ